MRIRTMMVTALAGTLLAGAVAAQTVVQGVVEAIDTSHVQVATARYVMNDATECQDLSGHRLALSEINVGAQVELDVDDRGTVATLRADVVR